MDNVEKLLADIKESLEREIGALRQETREGFAQMGKRLDRVEATLLHVDGAWRRSPAAAFRPISRSPTCWPGSACSSNLSTICTRVSES